MSVAAISVAQAIARFVDEHGVPNKVGPAELCFLIGDPNPNAARLKVGRVLTSERQGLNRALARHGLRVTAYGPSDIARGYKMASVERA